MNFANLHTGSYIVSASWLISPGKPPVAGGAMLVRDGRIMALGELGRLRRDYNVPIIDYPGRAILPGFVNAHTHLELTHFPSWRLAFRMEDRPRDFVDWLVQLVKIMRLVKQEALFASTCDGIRLCLESGTTSVGEIVTSRNLTEAYETSSLSGILFVELLGHDLTSFSDSLEEVLNNARISACGAFKPGLSPHSAYTVSEENMRLAANAACEAGLPICVHCAESREETDFIFASEGKLANTLYPLVGWERYLKSSRGFSPVELLDRASLLTPGTLAVHCVQISPSDAELLRDRRVTVAICPRSNNFLGIGKAPVALLKKLGVPMVLGTDSMASNDSLSLWDEIRFTLRTFKNELSSAEVFRMVTLGGAEALGLNAAQGSLEEGKRADFQIVGFFDEGNRDVLEQVMLQGTVEEVYVAGKKFVQNPKR